ncbi:putative Interferon-inducible GTPase 1 [Hypsibius exemplaris]|uniref:Interferon-inducible GTPase 1 n=1 Tax=Hypsibius exemplaris TaxID=2072580 RepID=A0A9X6NCB6_HYPEX|nr:putative Interferon-inducible GTPase 1 [Hypsibius exemplaris]
MGAEMSQLGMTAGLEIGRAVMGAMKPLVVQALTALLAKLQEKPECPKDVPAAAGMTAEQMREAARKAVGIDCTNHYNFGVTGISGTGKSSFINAVRGLKSNEPGAAPVGEDETTLKIAPFPHASYPHIVLWDTPGCGTFKIPAADYFQEQQLFCFDFLIVIIGRNIKEDELAIAKEARKNNVPVFFVRSKADDSIANIVNDEGVTRQQAVQKFKKIIEAQQENQLNKQGFPEVPLFAVSSRTLFNLFRVRTRAESETTQAANVIPDVVLDEHKLMQTVLTLAYHRRQYISAAVETLP